MAKARNIIEAEDPKAFLQSHRKWVVKPLAGTKFMVALFFMGKEVHNISLNAHMPSDGSGDPEVQRQVRELTRLGLMKENNDPVYCQELEHYLNWLQTKMPCPDLESWVTSTWLRQADAAGLPEKYTQETGQAAFKREGKTGVMRVKLTGYVGESEEVMPPGFTAVRGTEEIEWRYDPAAKSYRFTKRWDDDYTGKRREALSLAAQHQAHFKLAQEMKRWQDGGWTVTPILPQQEGEDPKAFIQRPRGKAFRVYWKDNTGREHSTGFWDVADGVEAEAHLKFNLEHGSGSHYLPIEVVRTEEISDEWPVAEAEDPKSVFQQMPRPVQWYAYVDGTTVGRERLWVQPNGDLVAIGEEGWDNNVPVPFTDEERAERMKLSRWAMVKWTQNPHGPQQEAEDPKSVFRQAADKSASWEPAQRFVYDFLAKNPDIVTAVEYVRVTGGYNAELMSPHDEPGYRTVHPFGPFTEEQLNELRAHPALQHVPWSEREPIGEAEDPKSVFGKFPRSNKGRVYITVTSINGVATPNVWCHAYFIDEVFTLGGEPFPGVWVSGMSMAKALGEHEPGPAPWYETHKFYGETAAGEIQDAINEGRDWGEVTIDDWDTTIKWALECPPELKAYLSQTQQWTRAQVEPLLAQFSDGDPEIIKKYDGNPADWSEAGDTVQDPNLEEGEDPKSFLQGQDARDMRIKDLLAKLELDDVPWPDSFKAGQRVRRTRHNPFGARPFGGNPNDIGDLGTIIAFHGRKDDPQHSLYTVRWDRHPIGSEYCDHTNVEAVPVAEAEDPKRFMQQYGRDFSYGNDGTIWYVTPLNEKAVVFLDELALPHTRLKSDGTAAVQPQYWQQFLALAGDAGLIGRKFESDVYDLQHVARQPYLEAEDPKSVFRLISAKTPEERLRKLLTHDHARFVSVHCSADNRLFLGIETMGGHVEMDIGPFTKEQLELFRREWYGFREAKWEGWHLALRQAEPGYGGFVEAEDPKSTFQQLPRTNWLPIPVVPHENHNWQWWFRNESDPKFWLKVIQFTSNDQVKFMAHLFHDSQKQSLTDFYLDADGQQPVNEVEACAKAKHWADPLLAELRLRFIKEEAMALVEAEDPKSVLRAARGPQPGYDPDELLKLQAFMDGHSATQVLVVQNQGGGYWLDITSDRAKSHWGPVDRQSLEMARQMPELAQAEWLGEAEDPKDFLKRVAPHSMALTITHLDGEEVGILVPVYVYAIGWQMGTDYGLVVHNFRKLVPPVVRSRVGLANNDWDDMAQAITGNINEHDRAFGPDGALVGESFIGEEGEGAIYCAWRFDPPPGVRAWMMNQVEDRDEAGKRLSELYPEPGEGKRPPEFYPESVADDIAKEAEKAEEPKSPEQADAGNYAKGHVTLHGFEIAIENAKGSTRSGVGDDGKPWSIVCPAHYGYIKGTCGKDKDHLDVYIGEKPTGMMVFVVNQQTKEGKFDEHKIMLGFESKDEAIATYDAAFTGDLGPKLRASVISTTVDKFKAWTKKNDCKKPFAELEEAEDPKTFLQKIAPRTQGLTQALIDSMDELRGGGYDDDGKYISIFKWALHILKENPALSMADKAYFQKWAAEVSEELERNEFVIQAKDLRSAVAAARERWGLALQAEAEALLDAEDPKEFIKRHAQRRLPERVVKIYVELRDGNAYEQRCPVTWEKARVMKGDGWYAGIDLHARSPRARYIDDDDWEDILSTVEYHIMDGPPDPDGQLDYVELHGEDYDGPVRKIDWKYLGNYEADQEAATVFFGGVVGFRHDESIAEGEDPKDVLRRATAEKAARQKDMLHLFKDAVYVRSVQKGPSPVMLRGIDKFCLSDAEPEPHVYTILDLEQGMAWHRNAWRLEDGGVHGERLFKSEPNAIGAQIDWEKLVSQIK